MPRSKIPNPKLDLKNIKFDRRFAAIVLIVGLLILVFYKKSLFIAALVNNQPITNFELLVKMNQQFRDQTLNQLLNEKIILQEARKKGIMVNDDELSKKILELEEKVGGAEALSSLLAQQGQSKETLKDQLRMQLLIEKMYILESTISAQMVEEFIRDNPDQLKASDSATQVLEAKEILTQQKLSEVFNERFTTLRQQAKIQIF